MRSSMSNKPANAVREYFEVHLTTKEKAQVAKWAKEEGLGMGAYVRWKFFDVRPPAKAQETPAKSKPKTKVHKTK